MKLYEIPKTKGATWKHGLPKRKPAPKVRVERVEDE